MFIENVIHEPMNNIFYERFMNSSSMMSAKGWGVGGIQYDVRTMGFNQLKAIQLDGGIQDYLRSCRGGSSVA